MKRWLSVTLLVTLLPLLQAAGQTSAEDPGSPRPFDPVDQYVTQKLEGWTVLVNKRLRHAEHDLLREQVLKLLDDHLYRISRVVPAVALARLRKMPIWVELAEPHHSCMCYHVSADWLRAHGMNPQKAGAVEIANARNFLTWTQQQPWMVLHELAHGYHDQVLGFDHPEIRACYERAVASKSYEAVLHHDGRKVRAYALTDPKEYFAEATEAYFGSNDFYPFVRAELKEHDPAMYALLEKLWGASGPQAGDVGRPERRSGG